jgi:hypothetical protein
LGRRSATTPLNPFAGSAAYSCFWEPKKVTLIDRDPVVTETWKFIQRASRRELKALPERVLDIDDLKPSVCQEARWLIGFNLNHGVTRPGVSMCNRGRNTSKWRSLWGKEKKQLIIEQQHLIQHWDIREGNYWDAPDVEAHWGIDPPYQHAGKMYRFHDIDYKGALAPWCLSRRGYIQVHEAAGADWLPFRPFTLLFANRANGHSDEWLFEQDNRLLVPPQ